MILVAGGTTGSAPCWSRVWRRPVSPQRSWSVTCGIVLKARVTPTSVAAGQRAATAFIELWTELMAKPSAFRT